MLQTGISLGIVFNLLIGYCTFYSGKLYLLCKDMSPMYVESLYELSYSVMKRAGIFFFATVVLISGMGCIMIYFIVFGDICKSLAADAYGDDTDNPFTHRAVYVIGLALVMLPICLKKKLAEMKFVAYTLFLAIALFILLFLV